MNDKESLVAAFKGADAIFSNTDFWTQFYNPATREKLKPGQSINEYCYDLEVQQGKNVADAAATVGGLDRFVLSALCGAKKLSKGKYTQVYHFDAKANIVEYVREQHPELAAKMSVVQVGVYMSNWKMMRKPEKVSSLIANCTTKILTSRSKTTVPTDSPTSAPAQSHSRSSSAKKTLAT